MRHFIYLMAEILVLDAFLGCATQPQNQVLDTNTTEFRSQDKPARMTTFPTEVTGVEK
jgi:hypothetical protein